MSQRISSSRIKFVNSTFQSPKSNQIIPNVVKIDKPNVEKRNLQSIDPVIMGTDYIKTFPTIDVDDFKSKHEPNSVQIKRIEIDKKEKGDLDFSFSLYVQ